MIISRRIAYFPFATFSLVSFGGKSRYILERANVGKHTPNATPPIFTCIPEGDYKLEAHSTPAHADTWAFVNQDLNVYHEAVPAMPANAFTAVLLHPANLASQLEACLAPGTALGFFGGVLGLGSSVDAFNEIHDYIKASGDLDWRIENGTSEPWPTT